MRPLRDVRFVSDHTDERRALDAVADGLREHELIAVQVVHDCRPNELGLGGGANVDRLRMQVCESLVEIAFR